MSLLEISYLHNLNTSQSSYSNYRVWHIVTRESHSRQHRRIYSVLFSDEIHCLRHKPGEVTSRSNLTLIYQENISRSDIFGCYSTALRIEQLRRVYYLFLIWENTSKKEGRGKSILICPQSSILSNWRSAIRALFYTPQEKKKYRYTHFCFEIWE